LWLLSVSLKKGTSSALPVWICTCHQKRCSSIIMPSEHRWLQHYNWSSTFAIGEACSPLVLIMLSSRLKYMSCHIVSIDCIYSVCWNVLNVVYCFLEWETEFHTHIKQLVQL
jgi:hypothetical protein